MNRRASNNPNRGGTALAVLFAVLTTLTAAMTGGAAMADVTRVIIDDPMERPIVTNGDVSIGLFRSTLVTQDSGTGSLENSLRIAFSSVAGDIEGVIEANQLALPTFPLQSVSLFADGGLMLEGDTLNSTGQWFSPSYDSISDSVIPAVLLQFNEFGHFQIQDFLNGDMAYIGYADADRTRFGYVQIQRQSLTQWTLIGHAYGDVGESILVEDLTTYIPVPSSMLALCAGSLLTGGRRRVPTVV